MVTMGVSVARTPPARLEARIREKLEDWRGLLTRNVQTGREVLRLLLVEPLRFTPVVDEHRRGFSFRGSIALDRLVSGVVDLPKTLARMASPTGTVNKWRPPFWGVSDVHAA
jgi:hypothetical protein